MEIQKKYIYDLLTRISHAGIGGISLLLFLSAQLANLFFESGNIRHFIWLVHIYLGYLLVSFFVTRIIWLFKGPKYSRLSNLIQIKEWKNILLSKGKGAVKWGWGHHPLASLAYLGLYLIIAVLIFSGFILARIQFDLGPVPEKYYDDVRFLSSYKDGHYIASVGLLFFTVVHIWALFHHQKKDKVPAFESMKTGYQYKLSTPGDLENEND
ncbi:MAG: cytochrome b/b6 domain-containing protein [Bacteriovorax sp.]|jgi:Ni,Fe-hydrogenase I cytochrome b subunit